MVQVLRERIKGDMKGLGFERRGPLTPLRIRSSMDGAAIMDHASSYREISYLPLNRSKSKNNSRTRKSRNGWHHRIGVVSTAVGRGKGKV
jgi:hypothetical protein